MFTITGYSGPRLPQLLSTFEDILKDAEEILGNRDISYSYNQISFNVVGGPKMVPCFHSRTLHIYLSSIAQNNMGAAIHEFAHEIVHSLRPTTREKCNYLEEGIATWFADICYAKFWNNGYIPLRGNNPHEIKCWSAKLDAIKILDINRQIIKGILNKRMPRKMNFSDINQNLLSRRLPNTFNKKVIKKLLKKFY